MTTKDNNNDTIVAENHNNIIVSNSVGVTESGIWICWSTKILVHKSVNLEILISLINISMNVNKEIVCDICGHTILKKKAQHTNTMQCRLTHVRQQ